MTRPFISIAATIAVLAAPAMAQSTMERMETVSVTINGMMNDALVAQIPALDGSMPAPEWDDTLRAAYTCMHDGYVALVGEEAVADMVTQMEASVDALTPESLLQGGGAVENPEGITDDQAIEIVTGCGLMEAFMARMTESGAMAIMMQQQ